MFGRQLRLRSGRSWRSSLIPVGGGSGHRLGLPRPSLPSPQQQQQQCFSSTPSNDWNVLDEPEFANFRDVNDVEDLWSSGPFEPVEEQTRGTRTLHTAGALRTLDEHPLLRDSTVGKVFQSIAKEKHEDLHGQKRAQALRRRGELIEEAKRAAERREIQLNRAHLPQLETPDQVEQFLFSPEAAELKPVLPSLQRSKMIDKRSLMTPEHAAAVTRRKLTNPQLRGPILDKNGQIMTSESFLRIIRKETDSRKFRLYVKDLRRCNFVREGSLLGVALMHALRSHFPLIDASEPLRGLVVPSVHVLTNALSVAIANGYGTDMLGLMVSKGAAPDGPCLQQPLPLHQALISQRDEVVKWLFDQNVRTDIPCSLSQRSTLEVALMSGMGHWIKPLSLEVPERLAQSRSIVRELVRKNHASSLRLLVEHKADLSASDSIADSPLVMAASMDHLETVEVLVKAGISVFDPLQAEAALSGREPRYSSAFAAAVRRGQLRTVRALLGWGADLNARHPETGITPLMEAVEAGETRLVDQLLSINADPYVWDGEHRNAMSIAVMEDNIEVVRCLLEHKLDLNTADPVFGVTPLMLAALHNREKLIRMLLIFKADPTRVAKNGQTALTAIMRTDLLHLIKPLLEAGADVNSRDEDGNSLLHSLILRGDEPALLDYVLTKQPSVHLSLKDPTLSPINLAVSTGNKKLVQLLIQHGYMASSSSAISPSPGVMEQPSWPLALAIKSKDLVMAALLMRHHCLVGGADPEGNTALHHALELETLNVGLVQALFRQGCNPFVRNKEGRTPYDLAPTPELKELLLRLNVERPEALHCLPPDDVAMSLQ